MKIDARLLAFTILLQHMDLESAIDGLGAFMNGFRGEAEHTLADIVLFNLAIEVFEQASAVRAVLATPFPRAALANARAVTEGAVDAAFLIADPARYDELAARIRVFELFERERIQRRTDDLTVSMPGASKALENAVRVDANSADAQSPGQGSLLRSALEYYSRNPPRIGDHWSGLSYSGLARELWGTDSKGDEMVKMLDAMYSTMSIGGSHARARTGQRTVTKPAPDRLAYSPDPAIRGQIEEVVALFVRLTIDVLNDRPRSFAKGT